MFVAKVLELLDKSSSHFLHAGRHHNKIVVPHLRQVWIAEDDVNNSGSLNWRVGVDWSCDLLDARHDNILLSLVTTDDTEATSSLTVETEVLGERLEEHNVVSMFSEESECKRVCFK
jgi:hypothetical protein